MSLEAVERFWSYVDMTGPCWLWTRHCNAGGYGAFWFEEQCWLAHRLAWHLTHTPLSTGTSGGENCILHRCDNRPCVRPSHLFCDSQTQNIQDMVAKHQQAGAPGVTNHHAKLYEADVRQIRALKRVLTQAQLAANFGVNRNQIRAIQYGKAWSHVVG